MPRFEDGPASVLPRGTSWPARVDELADVHPDAVALTTTGADGRQVTWGRLSSWSAAAASHMEERGVAPGSVVAIELPNGADHVVATLAAWRLGATILPVRPRLPAMERDRLLHLTAPSLLVGGVNDGPTLSEAQLRAFDGVDLPRSERTVVASPAWMIASGGSTGVPKVIAPPIDAEMGSGGIGVLSDSGSMFADTSGHRHPSHLVCAPLSHTHALSLLYRTLLDDFHIVLTERFDADQVVELIEASQISFVALVPTMLVRILRSPSFRSANLSSLECVLLGAGATPEWAVRDLTDRVGPSKVLLGYGSSEGVGAAMIRGDEWLAHAGSVGRPLSCEVRVVGEDGQDSPAGAVGELYFRSTNRTRSFKYLGGTPARSLPGGFISVGDLGWMDPDGYLYIADRRSDMIVTGGANVYVAEVEAALSSHPDVDDVVVIGLPDPEWGRRVHAVVATSRQDSPQLQDDLRRHCGARLASYKIPRSFETVERLDRSETGKVNRQALAHERSRPLSDGPEGAP